MTLYVPLDLSVSISENSDYSMPLERFSERCQGSAAAPATNWIRNSIHMSTVPFTHDMNMFSMIYGLIAVNHSITPGETVDCQWYHIKGQQGSSAAGVLRLDAAAQDTVTDVGAQARFVVNGAEAGSCVRVIGSAEGNDGAYRIDVAAANLVTLVPTSNFPFGGGATPENLNYPQYVSFERRNIQGIPPGGALVVTDNVQPLGDLVFTAEAGAPLIELLVIGTNVTWPIPGVLCLQV